MDELKEDDYTVPEGEESEFAVYRTMRQLGKVVVSFAEGRMKPGEILTLKKAVPEYSDISIVELRGKLTADCVVLGPFSAHEAEYRADRYQQYGLNAKAVTWIQESSLIMNDAASYVVHIEDEAEARAAVENALRRGVKLVTKWEV